MKTLLFIGILVGALVAIAGIAYTCYGVYLSIKDNIKSGITKIVMGVAVSVFGGFLACMCYSINKDAVEVEVVAEEVLNAPADSVVVVVDSTVVAE